MVYINTNKINEFKNLKDDDYYVITDFDRTLTTRESEPTMGIIPQFLGGKCLEERTRIFNYYRPIELDYTLDDEEKCKIMKEWAKKSFTLLSEYITNERIENSLQNSNIWLRDGTKEFLEEMKNKDIPVIIMSSGIGNIVKAFLEKEKCLFNNTIIVSNFFKFNNEEAYIDVNEIMATSNKEYERIPKNIREKLDKKNKLILLGDLVEDIKMINKENLENTLTIGFLDENIEQNLEKYNNNFDIVLTENSNFKDVKNILNIY